MLKQIKPENLPKDKLEEIRPLIANTKTEYIVIGETFYELRSTPAMKLLEIIKDSIDIFGKIKKEKIETYNEEFKNIEDTLPDDIKNDEVMKKTYLNNHFVYFTKINETDLFLNLEFRIKFKDEILKGVVETDFEKMTVEQLVDTVKKLIDININTLPQEVRAFFGIGVLQQPQPQAPEQEKEPEKEKETTLQ